MIKLRQAVVSVKGADDTNTTNTWGFSFFLDRNVSRAGHLNHGKRIVSQTEVVNRWPARCSWYSKAERTTAPKVVGGNDESEVTYREWSHENRRQTQRRREGNMPSAREDTDTVAWFPQ